MGGIAVIALNGCGGGSSGTPGDAGGSGNNPPPVTVEQVDIYALHEGYRILGHDSDDRDVSFDYCSDYTYFYYRGNSRFTGTFDISGDTVTINMWDSQGGSYVIDTGDGYLRVGEDYYIYDVGDDIIVDEILEIDC